jgi:hypothetical protein
MMEAVSTSEAPANFCQTTRRYNPENIHLHTRRRENLKSYFKKTVKHFACNTTNEPNRAGFLPNFPPEDGNTSSFGLDLLTSYTVVKDLQTKLLLVF